MVRSIVFGSVTGLFFFTSFAIRHEKLRQTKSFRFHLHAFAGASGFHNDYRITKDSLIVSYDSDNAGVEMHPVYAIKLDGIQATSFYDFLESANLDTLKPFYERMKYYSDGLWTKLEVETDFIMQKKIRIDEPSRVRFLSLVQTEINKLIKKKRYKMSLFSQNSR